MATDVVSEAYLKLDFRTIFTIGIIGILGFMLLQAANMAYMKAFGG